MYRPRHRLAYRSHHESISYGRPLISYRSARILANYLGLMIMVVVVTLVFLQVLQLRRLSTSSESSAPPRSPTRYHGGVPIVDRAKLAEVEARMIFHADGDNNNFLMWTAPINPASPPKVTGIPEDNKSALFKELVNMRSDEEADELLCRDRTPCRLLLPIWIGEQESKASKHLYQIGALAVLLNRTLVLPNMFKSRFGTCYRNRFSYYYAPDALDRFGISTVSFEDFQRWVASRATAPTARIFSFDAENNKTGYEDSLVSNHARVTLADGDPARGTRNHCLNDKAPRLSFESFPAVSIRPNVPKWYLDSNDTENFSNEIIQTIDRLPASDVLAVTWELRYSVFRKPPWSSDAHLEYSPRWITVANAVSTSLAPFLAIHWRMESVPSYILPSCARILVNTLETLIYNRGAPLIRGSSVSRLAPMVSTVYLATDYPLEGKDAKPHSGTFYDLNEEHHEAIRILKDAFQEAGALRRVRLTSLAEELSKKEREGLNVREMDQGLMGILDKTIAMQAQLFVSASNECGRQSSFTSQIVSTRQRASNEGGSNLRNIVQYFGSR